MNFETITGYFYKLFNICYLIVLAPMGIFIFLYVQFNSGEILPLITDDQMVLTLQLGLAVMGIVDLVTMHAIQKKRIKKIASRQGLRNKMEEYSLVAILRIAAGAVACLVMAAGFWLTNSEWFTVFLMLILVWLGFQWPTPRKMSNDLKLKGDEKDVILYKRDLLRNQ